MVMDGRGPGVIHTRAERPIGKLSLTSLTGLRLRFVRRTQKPMKVAKLLLSVKIYITSKQLLIGIFSKKTFAFLFQLLFPIC